LTIDVKQVCRYLRLYGRQPGAALEERIDAMLEAALKAMRPLRTWRRFDDIFAAGGSDSESLRKHLAGCHAVYLVCGTIGAAFDALQRKTSATSPSDAFVLQAIGAAAIEALMDETELEIRRELVAGETLVSRYSPGYGDYPLSEQQRLLTILDAPRTVGVSLTDALVMAPSKSVSAVIGVKTGEST
jgi:5-methyltetrahydrofolate--homocysteine methyltransferase